MEAPPGVEPGKIPWGHLGLAAPCRFDNPVCSGAWLCPPAGSPSLLGHEKSPHQSDASDSQERKEVYPMARKRHLVCPFLHIQFIIG